jgi:hypothetical protein
MLGAGLWGAAEGFRSKQIQIDVYVGFPTI